MAERNSNKKSEPHKRSATQYLYTVGWSEEDKSFIARVAEFPSLGAHGRTAQAALRQIRKVVAVVLQDLAKSGEPIPEPLGKQKFSGKLNLRMPSYLHRRLAAEAAQQRVSLNQLINLKLERNS